MKKPEESEEGGNKETKQVWESRKKGAFAIAFVIVALDILALALGAIVDTVPVALAIGCVGIITFVGILTLSNYLSQDPNLAKREVRKAIAASFTLVYLVLLALVVFSPTNVVDANTELVETIVGHFTWIVGIIIIFYFGSRSVDAFLKYREQKDKQGEKPK